MTPEEAGLSDSEAKPAHMGLLDLLKSLAGIDEWDFSDRRGALRIPCQLKGRFFKKDGEAVDVEIVDIGIQGLQVLVLGKLRKGSIVTLKSMESSDGHTGVACRIEWKKKHPRGFLSGISFQDSPAVLSESWLFEELREIGREALETEQRRTGIRVICNCPAKLRIDFSVREIQLVDLGLGGALVETEGEPLRAGDKVRFDLGPLDDLQRVAVNSEVVVVYKREPARYGLKFETFFVGGVTDLERYITYFYAKKKIAEKEDESLEEKPE